MDTPKSLGLPDRRGSAAERKRQRRLDAKKFIQLAVPVTFGLFVLVYLYGVAQVGSAGMYDRLVEEHPAAMLGLPLAAIGALCLVLLLRSASGPIEFEAIGFKFKGAAGPIIMWVITFVAMAAALKLLW